MESVPASAVFGIIVSIIPYLPTSPYSRRGASWRVCGEVAAMKWDFLITVCLCMLDDQGGRWEPAWQSFL